MKAHRATQVCDWSRTLGGTSAGSRENRLRRRPGPPAGDRRPLQGAGRRTTQGRLPGWTRRYVPRAVPPPARPCPHRAAERARHGRRDRAPAATLSQARRCRCRGLGALAGGGRHSAAASPPVLRQARAPVVRAGDAAGGTRGSRPPGSPGQRDAEAGRALQPLLDAGASGGDLNAWRGRCRRNGCSASATCSRPPAWTSPGFADVGWRLVEADASGHPGPSRFPAARRIGVGDGSAPSATGALGGAPPHPRAVPRKRPRRPEHPGRRVDAGRAAPRAGEAARRGRPAEIRPPRPRPPRGTPRSGRSSCSGRSRRPWR